MSATPSMILTVLSGRNTNVTVASTPVPGRHAKSVGVKEFSLEDSYLHVSYAENCRIFDRPRPASPDGRLIAAGDVAELFADIEKAPSALAPYAPSFFRTRLAVGDWGMVRGGTPFWFSSWDRRDRLAGGHPGQPLADQPVDLHGVVPQEEVAAGERPHRETAGGVPLPGQGLRLAGAGILGAAQRDHRAGQRRPGRPPVRLGGPVIGADGGQHHLPELGVAVEHREVGPAELAQVGQQAVVVEGVHPLDPVGARCPPARGEQCGGPDTGRLQAYGHLEGGRRTHAVPEQDQRQIGQWSQHLEDSVGELPDGGHQRFAAAVLAARVLHRQHVGLRAERPRHGQEVAGRAARVRQADQAGAGFRRWQVAAQPGTRSSVHKQVVSSVKAFGTDDRGRQE
jgi:hypothetical protein